MQIISFSYSLAAVGERDNRARRNHKRARAVGATACHDRHWYVDMWSTKAAKNRYGRAQRGDAHDVTRKAR